MTVEKARPGDTTQQQPSQIPPPAPDPPHPPAGAPDPPPIPPAVEVTRLAGGYMGARAVHVAAELGLADLLATGTTATSDIAARTDTDPDALGRLLRVLAFLGLVVHDLDGAWRLTAQGECLSSDHPQSVRQLVIMLGTEHYQIWAGLEHSIRTGQSAAGPTLGEPYFAYLAARPEAAATFHGGMADLVRNHHLPALSKIDLTHTRTLVDVGGGTGSMLRHALRAHPQLTGMLFDLPEVVANAVPELRTGELAGRCQLVGGDFFDAIPTGGDTYLSSLVVHDYDDGWAGRLLGNIRAAIPPDGQLVLLEQVLPPDGTAHPGVVNDLNMLVMSGGRERTRPEFERLLAASGFRLDRITPTPTMLSVITAVPA